MKKISQVAGLCGVVLLLFGIVALMFTRDFTFYTVVHLVAGGVLVVFSLVFNMGGLWSVLGERSTRYSANAVRYDVRRVGLFTPLPIPAIVDSD